MKRVILGGLLAATGAACGNALAADDTGTWYLSPMAQYSMLDRDRISKDDFGYQVGIGDNFAPHFAGELNYSNGTFKISHSGYSQKLDAYSLDLLYKLLPDSIFHPYFLAGGGEMDNRVGPGEKYRTAIAEAGVGLLTGIGSQTGATRLQLRTEAKYRLEFENRDAYGPKDPSDVLFGVGLELMFGPRPMVSKAVVIEPPPPPRRHPLRLLPRRRRSMATMTAMEYPTPSTGARIHRRATWSTPTAARSSRRSSCRA